MLLGTYSNKRNIFITSPRTRGPRRKRKDSRRRESIDFGHHRRARQLVRRRAFLEAARRRAYNLQNGRDAGSPRRETSDRVRRVRRRKKGSLGRDRDGSLGGSRSVTIEGASERACARARAGKEGRKRTRPRRVCRRSSEINPPRGEKKKNVAYPSLQRATTRL